LFAFWDAGGLDGGMRPPTKDEIAGFCYVLAWLAVGVAMLSLFIRFIGEAMAVVTVVTVVALPILMIYERFTRR
jgi:hypothetical protein